MNVKNHVYFRYCQRILNMQDKKEINEYTFQNKDKITDDIISLFNQATYLWTGVLGENKPMNFYIYDGICFVCTINNESIVTLYKLNYGFTEDIDKSIINGLLAEICKVNEKINKITEHKDKILPVKEYEISNIDNEISVLQEQIKILEKKKSHITEEINVINDELNFVLLEKDKIARQLVNSINYRMDFIENKNVANGEKK